MQVDVVVIGAGQAGLGVAYFLKKQGVEFVVLERGRVGETWLSQRWDNFTLNTPNWINGLPGDPYAGPDPTGFMTHTELVDSFEMYADRFDLPILTGVTVTGVRSDDGEAFVVTTESAGGEPVSYEARAVVVATGGLQTARVPSVGSKVPPGVTQLHTGTFRSADQLPAGSVVVVGGGQSGAQIVEELLRAGRTVYFSISNAPRVPRRYRGRDFMDWWLLMGVWDDEVADLDDPALRDATNPLVSGVGPLGHSMSLQQLTRDGVRLMGRLEDIEGGMLLTDDRVPDYIRSADEHCQQLRDAIDAYILEERLDVPSAEPDPADAPLAAGDAIEFLTRLDLEQAGVGTIIWSTGFTGDFSWIELQVTDERGQPIHTSGIAPVAGVFFVGLPWLHKRKSGVILGIEEDALRIATAVGARLAVAHLR